MHAFSYPETNRGGTSIVSKSRKLPDGRFEAVAALFFCGIRQNQRFVTAATRYKALRGAEWLINRGRK